MKLYLSSVLEHCEKRVLEGKPLDAVWDFPNLNILLSYAYARDDLAYLYPMCKSFLMDSGAFTIMNAKKRTKGNGFDIKQFAKEYATYVKKHNVKEFLELDIDSVFGFDTYVDCLHIVQDITGMDPIPVFHDWRGKDYFIELTKKKKRIAFGGVAAGITRDFSRSYLHWFADVAHENGCKLHALGVTDPMLLRKCAFDSCDSSSWTAGLRFGTLYHFNGHECINYDSGRNTCPPGMQISRECTYTNGREEWTKFAQYLESEL